MQVSVLTGYAASGGGFNNYLGALRSQGLIIGYWRNRLGKAERLILETLTQAFPMR
ncbi:MAG: hypothetical protein ACLQU2_23055 [Candidatus Binataceae bacterium]